MNLTIFKVKAHKTYIRKEAYCISSHPTDLARYAAPPSSYQR